MDISSKSILNINSQASLPDYDTALHAGSMVFKTGMVMMVEGIDNLPQDPYYPSSNGSDTFMSNLQLESLKTDQGFNYDKLSEKFNNRYGHLGPEEYNEKLKELKELKEHPSGSRVGMDNDEAEKSIRKQRAEKLIDTFNKDDYNDWSSDSDSESLPTLKDKWKEVTQGLDTESIGELQSSLRNKLYAESIDTPVFNDVVGGDVFSATPVLAHSTSAPQSAASSSPTAGDFRRTGKLPGNIDGPDQLTARTQVRDQVRANLEATKSKNEAEITRLESLTRDNGGEERKTLTDDIAVKTKANAELAISKRALETEKNELNKELEKTVGQKIINEKTIGETTAKTAWSEAKPAKVNNPSDFNTKFNAAADAIDKNDQLDPYKKQAAYKALIENPEVQSNLKDRSFWSANQAAPLNQQTVNQRLNSLGLSVKADSSGTYKLEGYSQQIRNKNQDYKDFSVQKQAVEVKIATATSTIKNNERDLSVLQTRLKGIDYEIKEAPAKIGKLEAANKSITVAIDKLPTNDDLKDPNHVKWKDLKALISDSSPLGAAARTRPAVRVRGSGTSADGMDDLGEVKPEDFHKFGWDQVKQDAVQADLNKRNFTTLNGRTIVQPDNPKVSDKLLAENAKDFAYNSSQFTDDDKTKIVKYMDDLKLSPRQRAVFLQGMGTDYTGWSNDLADSAKENSPIRQRFEEFLMEQGFTMSGKPGGNIIIGGDGFGANPPAGFPRPGAQVQMTPAQAQAQAQTAAQKTQMWVGLVDAINKSAAGVANTAIQLGNRRSAPAYNGNYQSGSLAAIIAQRRDESRERARYILANGGSVNQWS